ncbi:MAG: hypothetical protein QNI98_02630 [Woeseiaceae bacterium]|nr:hypothetical protein [Woeseiaceae bacterium]
MNKLSAYVNEIISLIVMLLMLVALISGQLNAATYQLAAAEAAGDDTAHISQFRLEDE